MKHVGETLEQGSNNTQQKYHFVFLNSHFKLVKMFCNMRVDWSVSSIATYSTIFVSKLAFSIFFASDIDKERERESEGDNCEYGKVGMLKVSRSCKK